MPQTRSKGAPASRVYSSSPAPQQVHFPSRKRTARTYGKQPTKRSLRQQTITQIDFLEPPSPSELDELEEAEEREFERRRKKRRRTEGDEIVRLEQPSNTDKKEGRGKKGRRKTDGDGLSSGSNFHTQTLTQLYGDGTIQDLEDGDGAGIGIAEAQGTKSPSVIPQTPLKKKTRVEIPSSQPSPCTPMLARYSPLGPRTSPLKSRSTNVGSPLPTPGKMGRLSRGLVIQDSFASGVTLESGMSQASVGGVKGGDSSQRLPSGGGRQTGGSAAQRSGGGSGRKRVFQRVEIPDSDAEDEDEDDFDFIGGDMTTLTVPDTPTKQHGSGKRASRLSFGPSPKKGLEVLADGDGAMPNTPTKQPDSRAPASQQSSGQSPEKEMEMESDMGEVIPDTPTTRFNAGRGSSWRPFAKAPKDVDMDNGGPARRDVQNSYPAGPDTQFAMDFIASSEENALGLSAAPQSSRPVPGKIDLNSLPSSQPPHQSPAPKKTPQHKKPTFVHFSSPSVSFEDEVHSPGQHKTQAYTQMGSQRVDFDVIRSMPAATGRSDVFISIYPEYAEHIADGTKDHEFRTWKLPVTVSRIWIYVTKPESRLRYMACVGPAKEPGQIEDESGLGNAEFNRGEGGAKFAHEILELYELNNPVSMNRIRENGWLEVPPQRFTFVPPVVVSQLQANLRCRVLPRDEGECEDNGLQDSQPRDSQEVEAQLLSDIAYSTQRPVDASSQGISRSRDAPPLSRPRSSKVQREDEQWQARPRETTGGQEIIPSSQATTASDGSIPRPPNPTSSIPVFHDSGSPVRMPEGDWGVDTSQLLGASQLLPDTLLKDHGPPEDFDF